MKRIIFAWFLLGTVASQMFPFDGVGQYFFGSQPVEEVVHASETDGKNNDGNEELKKSELFFLKLSLGISPIASDQRALYRLNKDYVSRLSDDRPTPPPLVTCSRQVS